MLAVVLFLLCGAFDLTACSTPKPFRIKTVEESISDLYNAIANVERRDTSDLVEKIKREIMRDLADWAAKEKEQILNSVAEMKAEVDERLQTERNERLLVENQIATEVKQLQRAANDTFEKITEVKNEVTSVSEKGRIEADMLEVKMKETEDLARSCLASQRDTEDAIRKDMSLSSVEIFNTLTNHADEISSINTRLIRVQNRCSDPPHVENGHLVDGGFEGRADHGAVVTYACRGNKIPSGNDKLQCTSGQWTGELPRCVNDYRQCGLDLRNVGIDGRRIVGGNSSSGAPAWPWIAAVYHNSTLHCGGSIIRRNFILTRAGCMYYYGNRLNGTDLTVRLGATDMRDLTHLQEYNVRTIYVHPLYNRHKYWDYDIALLELDKPIDYNPFVRPVCLPPQETPEYNRFYKPQSSARVLLWRKDGSTHILKEYPYVIQPPDTCKEKLEDKHTQNFTNRMFCAASERASCLYAGGSVAMQSRLDEDGDLVWTLVGIGDDGHWSCLRVGSKKYSFFARLQKLVPWVEETVEDAASRG